MTAPSTPPVAAERATDEYQPRTIDRLVEILRSFGYGPRSWQSEAADRLAALSGALEPGAVRAWAVLDKNGKPNPFAIWPNEPGPAIKEIHVRNGIIVAPVDIVVATSAQPPAAEPTVEKPR